MFKQFCPLSYLTKKRAQLVITMFLITFVAFMWVELASTKPIYNGKPIDYWITHPQTAKPFASYGAKRFSPDEVYFPKVDSKAVPFLIRALMRKDGRFDKAYRNVFNKLPFAIRGRLPIPKQP